jgi:hypothetical protein
MFMVFFLILEFMCSLGLRDRTQGHQGQRGGRRARQVRSNKIQQKKKTLG